MTGLKQEASGTYQGEAKDSKGGTLPYKKICLQVCPGELFAEGRGLPGVSRDIRPLRPFPSLCHPRSHQLPAPSHTDRGQLGLQSQTQADTVTSGCPDSTGRSCPGDSLGIHRGTQTQPHPAWSWPPRVSEEGLGESLGSRVSCRLFWPWV